MQSIIQSIMQPLSPSTFHAKLEMREINELQQLLAELLADLKSRHYHFIAISPYSHALVNQRPDNRLAFDLQGVFGWGRVFAPPLLGEAWFTRLKDAAVIVPQDDYWLSRVAVASMDGCLLLHSAYPANDEYAVRLGPDDYRFYNWIDHYLTLHKPAVRRAVDVGCGCGGITMVLAARLPQANIWGVDSNPLALALASASAAGNGLPHLQWQQGALLSSLQGEFDLIVANMAYLQAHFHANTSLTMAALHSGDGVDGHDFDGVSEVALVLAIVQEAIQRLAVRGTLLLYARVPVTHGHDALREGVEALLHGSSLVFEYEELDPDIAGELLGTADFQQVDRVAAVILALHKPLR